MPKRVRLTNEILNAYGTWLVTSGGNIEQYKRNPVLLYMHSRGKVIGILKDIKVEGDEITAELSFDEATELSIQCKKQYEFGSLKMVSIGADIIETSDDPKLIKEGQRYPTITKWKLTEVSLVDIGANDDAIVLKMDGKTINLGKDGENPLPLLNNNQNTTTMNELQQLALELGMAPNANAAQVLETVRELKLAKEERDKLKTQIEKLQLDAISNAVDTAIKERRMEASQKDHFINLGQKIGLEDLKTTLSAMAPVKKPSETIFPEPQGTVTYKKLSEVPAGELIELRKNDPAKYKALYKAEYGRECEL